MNKIVSFKARVYKFYEENKDKGKNSLQHIFLVKVMRNQQFVDISGMLNPKKHLSERKEVEESLELIPQRTEPNLLKSSITRRSHL